MSDAPTLHPQFLAGLDMIRRTGARSVQVRYQDDEEPTVWMVVAEHVVGGGRPLPRGKPGRQTFTVGAGLTPQAAATDCCALLIDGGLCAHCGNVAVFDDGGGVFAMPGTCWTKWDPDSASYRRSCE